MAAGALELLEIDAAGLDEMDKRLLRLIADQYKGGPVGISTLAVAAGEEPETLEEVHEPFLIQNGFLKRTPQGRVITEKGLHAIGLKAAMGDQGSLF
jgi:Holliday junction DNA helicase RuvB